MVSHIEHILFDLIVTISCLTEEINRELTRCVLIGCWVL